MEQINTDQQAFDALRAIARSSGIGLDSAKVCRTSSRFCLGVEHGDYNGTELFGVGTDRFIWMAYRPTGSLQYRLYSGNFPADGLIQFQSGDVPPPQSPQISHTWARFPYGVDYILRNAGYRIRTGIEAVIVSNIPGGGMSRSASLTLNLILSILQANGITEKDQMRIVDLAQAVENQYIGSPCGKLDQIMILFAREGTGTHYIPQSRSVRYVPLGKPACEFRIMVMDTGTVRPGLEKSTYTIRRAECEKLVSMARQSGFRINCLADIKDDQLYEAIKTTFGQDHPDLVDRMTYIYQAQQRFYQMMEAWKKGDIETVGAIFRQDGIGLRDLYKISGPELETMCDIVRTIPGVLGERMLGGGDKGASGALVKAEAVEAVKEAVRIGYPRSRPGLADRYAVHVCKVVEGVKVFEHL